MSQDRKDSTGTSRSAHSPSVSHHSGSSAQSPHHSAEEISAVGERSAGQTPVLNQQQIRDLSSLPEEFTASKPITRKAKPTEAEIARRRLRARRLRLILIGLFFLMIVGGVFAALMLNKDRSLPTQQEVKNSCTASVAPAAPGDTQINVLNRTSGTGLATKVGEMFAERGFQVKKVGNFVGVLEEMPSRVDVTVVIIGNEASLPQALAVQRQLPASVFVLDEKRKSSSIDLVLIDKVKALKTQVDSSQGPLICK